MLWCPVCKKEYEEEITNCPDCDTVLESHSETDCDTTIHAKAYKSPEERYKDMYSSAWTFLLIGVAGLLFMVLSILGIVNLPLHNFALFVMAALFLVFIVVSIVSFQSAGKLKNVISSENQFMQEVLDWYHNTGAVHPSLTALDPDQPEELLYFQKSEIIRNLILERFPQIEQPLLDKLTDDFCEEDFSS